MSKKIILAIETAIEGGSISLLENEREIDFWIGKREVSKAEDILVQAADLLKKNKIEKTQIDLVAFSSGPGSITGIRIGFATVLGLQRSWNCRWIGVSVLEALLLLSEKPTRILTAVPLGRKQVACQIFGDNNFNLTANKLPEINTFKEFIEFINQMKVDELIVHDQLFSLVDEQNQINSIKKATLVNAGKNLAKVIGIRGLQITDISTSISTSKNLKKSKKI
jgi:tRNA threonylcarbamoyladenosine biosynthesis protein TsaB